MYQVKIVKGRTTTNLNKTSKAGAMQDLKSWSKLGNNNFTVYIDNVKMHEGTAEEILAEM